MSYEVMRHEKIKGPGIREVCKHNNAEKEKVLGIRKTDLKSGSTSIIIENLRLNKQLVQCENFKEKADELIAERLPGKTIRKDAIKVLNGVYTMTPDKVKNLCVYLHIPRENDDEVSIRAKKKWLEEHEEWVNEFTRLSKEEQKTKAKEEHQWCLEYFKECVNHENRHYGECISAVIHFHEDTPHLHTATVPLIKDKEIWRLSGRDVLGNKARLSQLQSIFHDEVGSKFGLERGKCRTQSELRKHTNKAQHQLECK